MNLQRILYRVSQLLSRFREQIKILNSNSEFSINIHAENILIKILNELYNCNLENVNYSENKTYPSIDLRDKSKRIAIQVTSTADLKKVKDTLTTFINKGIYKEFDKLLIFIITEKQSKYDQSKINEITDGKFTFKIESIIDRTDIYLQLNKQNDLEKVKRICVLLEEQFSDNKHEFDKWDLYCKGLEEYDNYIKNYYHFLDIKGFSPKVNNTQIKIDLEKIYVPLALKTDKKEDIEITYSIEKALNHFNKLVILGDPGSGKSTIIKHLAYKICSQRPTENKLHNLVPLVIKGSDFSKYVSITSKKLSEYIIDFIDKRFEFLFTEKLESNHLLVLIDGIDEINNVSLRHSVVNRINAFIAQYPKIKIIVSSRIVGYKETRLNGYFDHLQVVKFKKEQIKQFISSWYLSIASNSDKDIEKAKKNANELFRSIQKNDSVLKMASNPLLITIIALIHHQGGTLPEKRVSLYDIASSTFLENWVRQRDTHRNSSFDKEALISILAPIAYHIHQNYTTGLITETNLKNLFRKEYKKIYPFQSKKDEVQDLKDLINFLREDAGFLFEKGLNKNGEALFGFVHQTFQEYFTSIEFKTRWKEKSYKNNLQKYTFNPNWTEVIKLAASSFKFTEQSRLGRQYTTEFLKDILNVDDPIAEMYRPLKLIFQILIDDTEIEFSFFIKLIDKVFNEILSLNRYNNQTYEDNWEVYTFNNFITSLLETKTYQNYLVERIMDEVNNKHIPFALKSNLIQILMDSSNIQTIKDKLIIILKSDKTDLKKLIFNYNTVFPVSAIVLTKEFRTSIVNFINDEEFIKNYQDHLPHQYHCSFDNNKTSDFDGMSAHNFSNEYWEELFLSIRLINNENMKMDFINYLVFSIGTGMKNLEYVKKYLNSLKKEYPNLEFPKIENYIIKLEKFHSLNLKDYESFKFKDVKIYAKKDHNHEFAFIKNDKIQIFTYPFKEDDLIQYFGKDTKSFLKFIDFINPVLIASETKLNPTIKTHEDFLIFMQYENTITWSNTIKIDNIAYYALLNLFNNGIGCDVTIMNWLKNQFDIQHKMFDLPQKFKIKDYLRKIEESKLSIHNKLFLISILGERSDFEHLITPTIKSMNNSKSEEEKKEIKDILYYIL